MSYCTTHHVKGVSTNRHLCLSSVHVVVGTQQKVTALQGTFATVDVHHFCAVVVVQRLKSGELVVDAVTSTSAHHVIVGVFGVLWHGVARMDATLLFRGDQCACQVLKRRAAKLQVGVVPRAQCNVPHTNVRVNSHGVCVVVLQQVQTLRVGQHVEWCRGLLVLVSPAVERVDVLLAVLSTVAVRGVVSIALLLAVVLGGPQAVALAGNGVACPLLCFTLAKGVQRWCLVPTRGAGVWVYRTAQLTGCSGNPVVGVRVAVALQQSTCSGQFVLLQLCTPALPLAAVTAVVQMFERVCRRDCWADGSPALFPLITLTFLLVRWTALLGAA